MDSKKLLMLIKKDEGLKLDFKQKIELITESGKKELARDICAIANSKGGRGYIIIGIEDKTKKIIGISTEDITEEQIQQIVSSRCDPPIPISLEFEKIQGKTIGIISIYDGHQKPYQLRDNGVFYIRRGSTTDAMRKQELISALQDSNFIDMELCPIINSDISCFNNDYIDRYLKNQGLVVTDDNRLSLMRASGIVKYDKECDTYKATLGGILVFSDESTMYIPNNMVRIVNKIKKDYEEVVYIKGNLIKIIDETEKTIKEIFPKEYPVDAVHEGIKNAVLYRDYSVYNKEIEVVIDFNSTTIISPGTLIKGSDASSHGYYKRNMWIFEKLITIDNNNRFLNSGRGFIKMKKAFKNRGKVIFINSQEENVFKVIYPGVNNFKII